MIDPFMLGLPAAGTALPTGTKAARSGRDFAEVLANTAVVASEPLAAIGDAGQQPTLSEGRLPLPAPPPVPEAVAAAIPIDVLPALLSMSLAEHAYPSAPPLSHESLIANETLLEVWRDRLGLPEGDDCPLSELHTDWETLTGAVGAVAGAAHEIVEVVSRPWHLQANAGLSYRSISDGLAEEIPDLPQETSVATVIEALHLPAPVASRLSSAIARIESGELAERSGALPNEHRTPAPLVDDAEAIAAAHVMAGTTGWAPMVQWPHRLLRWHHDDGAGGTAWVRDYSFDLADAAALIDALRRLADQQGVSLRRIVLNGHELWRSSSST